jgi:hypothetical protein
MTRRLFYAFLLVAALLTGAGLGRVTQVAADVPSIHTHGGMP